MYNVYMVWWDKQYFFNHYIYLLYLKYVLFLSIMIFVSPMALSRGSDTQAFSFRQRQQQKCRCQFICKLYISETLWSRLTKFGMQIIYNMNLTVMCHLMWPHFHGSISLYKKFENLPQVFTFKSISQLLSYLDPLVSQKLHTIGQQYPWYLVC